jgi:maltooligosyltrehalose synthase
LDWKLWLRIVVEGSDDAFPITIRKEIVMRFSTRIRAARTALANRRTERIAHRQLAKELAAFQTPSERAELDQLLGRHSAEETREIREILNRQDYERLRRSTVLGGFRA